MTDFESGIINCGPDRGPWLWLRGPGLTSDGLIVWGVCQSKSTEANRFWAKEVAKMTHPIHWYAGLIPRHSDWKEQLDLTGLLL